MSRPRGGGTVGCRVKVNDRSRGAAWDPLTREPRARLVTPTALACALGRIRQRAVAPHARLAGRNRTKADILVYRLPEGEFAVKDYGARPWWMRWTLGRWQLAREARAYAAARQVEGIPECFGRLGPHALVLAYVPGRTLAELAPGTVAAQVFDRLERIVAALHARGVALGDLHHRDVILDEGGGVWVVDLATAWWAPSGTSRWRRRIFERLARLDRIHVARLRARFLGEDPDAAAARLDPEAAAWHARGRRWKRFWDRLRGRQARR